MKLISTLFLSFIISIKLIAGGCTPPLVTSQPLNVVVCENGNTFFQIVAIGPSIVYQWQIDQGAGFVNLSNVAPFSGVTTDLLTITTVPSALDNSIYRCIVTNGCVPDDTSDIAQLKVNVAPNIASQPSNAIVCEGETTTFSLITSGTGLSYQWQVDDGSGFVNVPAGPPYSGDTTGALYITGTTLLFDGYSYQCIVSGSCSAPLISTIVTLTVNTLTNINTQPSFFTMCENDTATISIIADGTSINYQWQENQGSGYVNLINSSLFSGVNTNSLIITGATASMNGYLYQCIVSGACMPADTSYEIPLIVYPAYSIFTSATICQGDTLVFGGSNLTAPGFYSNNFPTINSCDSIVYLSLNVNSAFFTTTASVICDGDSALLGGVYQSTAGVYTFILPAVTGCDSTIEHTLNINPSYLFSDSTAICDGDSALIFGVYQTIDSVYTDNYSTFLGCDSSYSHRLIINPVYDITLIANICQGDSILIGGGYESIAGTFINNYSSIYGCDSVVKTTLFVHLNYNETQTLSICSYDSVFLEGAYQNTAGVYTDSLNSFYGCDSIVSTTLTVNNFNVGMGPFPYICHIMLPVILNAGTPSGGIYSGPGITSDSIFSPMVVGQGFYLITYSYTDSVGCSGSITDTLEVQVCEDVPEIYGRVDFNIYPNPFNEIFIVESFSSELVDLIVYNVLGEIVYSQQINKGKTEINLSGIASGVYFIQNSNGDKVSTQKLIKK